MNSSPLRKSPEKRATQGREGNQRAGQVRPRKDQPPSAQPAVTGKSQKTLHFPTFFSPKNRIQSSFSEPHYTLLSGIIAYYLSRAWVLNSSQSWVFKENRFKTVSKRGETAKSLSCLNPWANLFVIGLVCSKDRAVWGKCSTPPPPLRRGYFSWCCSSVRCQPPVGERQRDPDHRREGPIVYTHRKETASWKEAGPFTKINPESRAHIAGSVSKVRDCGPRRKLGWDKGRRRQT